MGGVLHLRAERRQCHPAAICVGHLICINAGPEISSGFRGGVVKEFAAFGDEPLASDWTMEAARFRPRWKKRDRGRIPVGNRKKQDGIWASEVLRVFNDARIEQLAAIAQLPDSADRQRFSESIREAARIYAEDARNPTVGMVRDEIAALYKAAERRRYERAAILLAELSPQAGDHLTFGLEFPGAQAAGLRLPTFDELRDPKRRDEACDMIERLGGYIEGRKRPSGKRSRTWTAETSIQTGPRAAICDAPSIGVVRSCAQGTDRHRQPIPIRAAIRQHGARVPQACRSATC
jgi:hypothetical protein